MNEIFKRVSVRNFTEQKVEEEKLQQILKAAMQAPSAGNQMPWEFYVVTDKAKIEELSQCSQYAGCAANAPAVIVPCYRTEDLKFPEFDQIDTAIATEHILLESVSLGLGAGIPHYNDCNTLSRQSSRLLHRCCLWRSGIFFAFTISEKSTCLRIFKTILRKTLKFAAALSFRTRQ